MQVKLFRARTHQKLEESINAWLTENTKYYVKDIKFVAAPKTFVDLDYELVCLILYQA